MLNGLAEIPDGLLLGAPVDIEPPLRGQLKSITLAQRAAAEAIADARVDFDTIDLERFACACSAHMTDTSAVSAQYGLSQPPDGPAVQWWEQCLPNSSCALLAQKYGLLGPRVAHSTACASGLIDVLAASRFIRDGQCDIALAGSGEGINPLFAAAFHNMKVLAYDDVPERAARPFDRDRKGFVLGEGAAMFVLERLRHAQARGARIYAEIRAGKMLGEAHHVTGMDRDSDTLGHLINETLRAADLIPSDIGYINAHGTGTEQNDVAEIRGIRRAFGTDADDICISSTKSMIGHLVNASGSVELALTALAMRDGFAPPTVNLHNPDPDCDLDCLPLVGRVNRFQHALKLSVAFGGHLAAAALSRWNDARCGFAYPTLRQAA
jgi:3-oxoacyl-(acyl-carrier-protein) synthase